LRYGQEIFRSCKKLSKKTLPCFIFCLHNHISFFPSCFSEEVQNQEAVKEEGSTWNPYSAGPVTTLTAPLCGRAKFVVQPFFFYNRTRGVFNEVNNLLQGDKKTDGVFYLIPT